MLGAFLAQFYDDKPTPKLILLSHEIEEPGAACARRFRRARACASRSSRRSAARNAISWRMLPAMRREALARRLADTSSQEKLLAAAGAAFGLDKAPRRIEVYDNSHIMGTNAIGAMIVAGPQGFMKTHYRTFNIKSRRADARRRLRHDARGAEAALHPAGEGESEGRPAAARAGRGFLRSAGSPADRADGDNRGAKRDRMQSIFRRAPRSAAHSIFQSGASEPMIWRSMRRR